MEDRNVKWTFKGQAEEEGLQVAVRTTSKHPYFWIVHVMALSYEIKHGSQTGGLERPAQRKGGVSSVSRRTFVVFSHQQITS